MGSQRADFKVENTMREGGLLGSAFRINTYQRERGRKELALASSAGVLSVEDQSLSAATDSYWVGIA